MHCIDVNACLQLSRRAVLWVEEWPLCTATIVELHPRRVMNGPKRAGKRGPRGALLSRRTADSKTMRRSSSSCVVALVLLVLVVTECFEGKEFAKEYPPEKDSYEPGKEEKHDNHLACLTDKIIAVQSISKVTLRRLKPFLLTDSAVCRNRQ